MTDRSNPNQSLKVFLCHSSGDKPAVRSLYQRLQADGLQPWLDEEDLLPGQDWDREIRKAVRAADVVLVCLSKSSISKAGYVQKEIKHALDIADEQSEDTIFLIPVKLEECDVPDRLSRWHWVNLFEERGYARLIRGLQARANALGKVLQSAADGSKQIDYQAPANKQGNASVPASIAVATAASSRVITPANANQLQLLRTDRKSVV